MELKDLEQQERVVLAALVKLAVMSDGVVSENEAGEIDGLVAELGESAWQEALDVAKDQATDRERFRAMLDTVTRPGARELLYGTVVQLAIPESIDPGEGELLEMLSEAWDLKVQFESDPTE